MKNPQKQKIKKAAQLDEAAAQERSHPYYMENEENLQQHETARRGVIRAQGSVRARAGAPCTPLRGALTPAAFECIRSFRRCCCSELICDELQSRGENPPPFLLLRKLFVWEAATASFASELLLPPPLLTHTHTRRFASHVIKPRLRWCNASGGSPHFAFFFSCRLVKAALRG